MKQMILYRSILPIYYHLLLVVSGWLSRKWKIFEKSCGFYRSATIDSELSHIDVCRVGFESKRNFVNIALFCFSLLSIPSDASPSPDVPYMFHLRAMLWMATLEKKGGGAGCLYRKTRLVTRRPLSYVTWPG